MATKALGTSRGRVRAVSDGSLHIIRLWPTSVLFPPGDCRPLSLSLVCVSLSAGIRMLSNMDGAHSSPVDQPSTSLAGMS